jgi:hypothetical protein
MTLKIPLYGGLGNQLFGYAFGLYLEKFHACKVEFVVFRDYRGNKSHSQNIFIDFKLAKETLWSVGDWSSRLNFRARKLSSVAFSHRKNIRRLPFVTEDQFINFGLKTLSKEAVVAGYFRSKNYLGALQGAGYLSSLVPRQLDSVPSSLIELVSQEDVVVAHIRRGDYLDVAKDSILSAEYFARAAESFEKIGKRQVVVFSDSPDLVRHELLKHKETKHWLLVSLGLDKTDEAAATLYLASMANSLIMSNSTFSWWAASTGNLRKAVIWPQGWNAEIMEPHWISLTAQYMNSQEF